MYTLVEALVRERMHEQRQSASRARQVQHLADAQRRHRRLERARAAEVRHHLRVQRLTAAVDRSVVEAV